jgi:hypothetical protein
LHGFTDTQRAIHGKLDDPQVAGKLRTAVRLVGAAQAERGARIGLFDTRDLGPEWLSYREPNRFDLQQSVVEQRLRLL